MKTLILYATKHGAAREIAHRISDHMDGAVIHDLKQGGIPDLAEFDRVIIGSSLYAGSIRKEAKAFLAQHVSGLRQKTIGLFLSGIAAGEEEKYFTDNFPPDILQSAKASSFLGGIFDPEKAGKLERMVIKIVTKKASYRNTIEDEKIKMFAETMTS